jgi:hypothetical protein
MHLATLKGSYVLKERMKCLSKQINQGRQSLYTWSGPGTRANQNMGITLAAAALGATLILVMPSTSGLTSHLHTFLHDDFFTRL